MYADLFSPSHPLQDGAAVALAISTARRHGHTLSRRIADPARDRDDHLQDILVDLLQRAHRFDPKRGAWGAFVSVVTSHAASAILRRHISQPAVEHLAFDDIPDDTSGNDAALALTMDVRSFEHRLSEPLLAILSDIAGQGTVTAAQRAGSQSAASFYRSLRQLRLRLIAAGLGPAGETRKRLVTAKSH